MNNAKSVKRTNVVGAFGKTKQHHITTRIHLLQPKQMCIMKVVRLIKHRKITEDDVFELAGIKNRAKAVIYARVSTKKQSSSLENQINTLLQYANSNGFEIDKVYKDIASGLSFDRGEFQTLLMDVIQYKVKAVFITNKDRFSRISFNMWKELFAYFNCRIVVLNETEDKTENEEKEIFEDIISMIHCFAMKMYSKRRKNKLKLIEENLEIEK